MPRAIGEELRRSAADRRTACAYRHCGDIDRGHSAGACARRPYRRAARRRSRGTSAPLPLDSARVECSRLQHPTSGLTELRSPSPSRTSYAVGACARSAILQRCHQPSSPPGWVRTVCGGSGGRAARRCAAARAGGAEGTLRRIARSRMADRRARAAVVRAGPPVRAAVRSSRAARSRRGRRCT